MNLADKIKEGGWSLFLDRDGVINRQVKDGYVLNISMFEFLPGAKEAIPILNSFFDNIFIVTNQQCIGKGMLDMEGLTAIHNHMLDRIRDNGGYISDIFVSPFLDSEEHPYRKPGTGMALDAMARYPGVKPGSSVMAGDSLSDMQFGRNSGMVNILIGSGKNIPAKLFDMKFKSLNDFATHLAGIQNE